MRKLDILVPIYNEGEETIKELLDSIALQQSVDLKNDVGVIVCCDGGTTILSDEFMKRYPFTIEFYMCDHKGVSATRNECLDRSKAEYVAFCDCDDMLMNVCGLYIIFREFTQGFDSLISVFMEETRNPETKEPIYTNHTMDSTFVHGKVHRRQYLIDNHIRWNDKLTIHEDSFFNILCQNLSENVKYCQVPFYLWKWRDNSVCRHDPKYILKTYRNMLDSNDALIDEFLKRGRQDKSMFYKAFMCFDSYYTMNKPDWINQENQEYRDLTEKRFKEWFEKHEDLWNAVPINDKMIISNQVRSRSITEGMQMEAVTIDGWLKHVKGL